MALDLNELRGKFEAANPQVKALAIGAIAALEAGLNQLAALGHRLEVNWAGEAPVLIWPKMIYRDGFPPRTVDSKVELEAALADGWREHPSDPGAQVGPRPSAPVPPEVEPQNPPDLFATTSEEPRDTVA